MSHQLRFAVQVPAAAVSFLAGRQFYVYIVLLYNRNIPEFVHVTADDISSVPVAFSGSAAELLAKKFSRQDSLQSSCIYCLASSACCWHLRAAAAAAASWLICEGCSLLQRKPRDDITDRCGCKDSISSTTLNLTNNTVDVRSPRESHLSVPNFMSLYQATLTSL